jgi:[ribosomal protein S5]-alanine N-acetyltransferase
MDNIPLLTNSKALKYLLFIRENHERQRKEYPKLVAARKPRFDYKNLPDSDHLCYELMTWNNYKQVLDLFENDPNPYVSQDFKTLYRLENYVVDQLEYSRFSFKQGACDWFLRLKHTNELVGFLHIYGLNWELIDGKHPVCAIGYAIGEKYRQKGYATEATTHLLQQIPIIFQRYEVIANSNKTNTASRRLLEILGFTEDYDIGITESWWQKRLVDEIPLKTVEQVRVEEEAYR